MFRSSHILTLGACFLTVIAGVGVARAAAPTTVTMEVVWGESWPTSAGFKPAAALFEAKNPGINVKFQWAGYKGGVKESILAGDPPDIIMLSLQQTASWAYSGLIQPLNAYLQADNVAASDFIAPAWAYGQWHDQAYAIGLETDPNFALGWNKDLFSSAGLDPDRGPATLSEYESDFKKLTRSDGNKIVSIADRPWGWGAYGGANAVLTWSWIFGGSFYDPQTQKITINDPRNVEALTFLQKMVQQYKPYMAPGLSFDNGTQAMSLLLTSDAKTWRAKHPGKLGIGFEPYRPGYSQPDPAWLGGWAVAIPTGAKHPKAAWELLRYLTATKEGTATFAEPADWMPVYLPSPAIHQYLQDPIMSVYAKVAQNSRHNTPSIPVFDDFNSALGNAYAQVLSGNKPPKQVLDAATKEVQAKLDAALSQKR